MTRNQIEGIDYFTGNEYPLSELRIITEDKDVPDTPIFPVVDEDFAKFAALFAKKYGVAKTGRTPIVLSVGSLEAVRRYYESGMTL